MVEQGASGERGKQGDHGQDGQDGGVGKTGLTGKTGASFPAGGMLVLFLVSVAIFGYLAWHQEQSDKDIRHNQQTIAALADTRQKSITKNAETTFEFCTATKSFADSFRTLLTQSLIRINASPVPTDPPLRVERARQIQDTQSLLSAMKPIKCPGDPSP